MNLFLILIENGCCEQPYAIKRFERLQTSQYLMARKKILITVTSIPLPSRSYDELVCTVRLLEDGSWIHVYSIPLSFIRELKIHGKVQQTNYSWIELDVRWRNEDFRPESHSPIDYDFKDLMILNHIDTKKLLERKKAILYRKS